MRSSGSILSATKFRIHSSFASNSGSVSKSHAIASPPSLGLLDLAPHEPWGSLLHERQRAFPGVRAAEHHAELAGWRPRRAAPFGCALAHQALDQLDRQR